MPKATVGANARARPEKTRRRPAKSKVEPSVLTKTVEDNPIARLSFVRNLRPNPQRQVSWPLFLGPQPERRLCSRRFERGKRCA
jgi:hypothetical protein